MQLTRKYRFCASHRLHSSQLSDEENREVYGKCNNPYGHGHDYVLEVSVSGPVDGATGRVVDLAALDDLVQERILKDLDHRFLNVEVPEFASLSPTTENLSLVVERRLEEAWPQAFPTGPGLARIRIQETKRNTIEVRAS